MAKDYKKIYESKYGTTSSSSSSTASKLQSQINNYKARLEAGGVDVDSEDDDRNALEKLLNLKQDQGLIKDTFELLNRPQQALFGAINAAQKGESALEGAKNGITGNTDTAFKDILVDAGMSDTEGKLDLADVLGFAGDIFLDPMDLAVIPVKGASAVSKIANAADTASDVAKAANTASDIAKAADTASDISKAAKNTTQFKSLNDLLLQGATQGVKKGLKLTDSGIEKALETLDKTKGVNAYDDMGNLLSTKAKIAYDDKTASTADRLLSRITNEDELGGLASKTDTGRLEGYRQLKDSVKNIFKKSDAGQRAIMAGKSANITEDETKIKMRSILKKNEDLVKDYAQKAGKNADDVGEDVSLFVESMMDRSIEKDKLLEYVKEGKTYSNGVIENVLEDMKKQLPEELQNNLDLSINIDKNGLITLGSGWDSKVLKENGVSSFKDLDEANSIVSDYGNWYNPEDLAKIDELSKDQDFRGLINELFGEIDDGDKIRFDGDNVKILKDTSKHVGPATDKHAELMSKINPKYENAAEGYAHGGYFTEINDEGQVANSIEDFSSQYRPIVKNLDEAIENNRLTENVGLTKLDRANHIREAFGLDKLEGVNGSKNLSLEDLQKTADELKGKIGEEFKLGGGFKSTAVGEGFNYFTNSKDTYMEIIAPSGTKSFITNPDERELILGRAQKMVLKDVGVKNDKLFIRADLLNDDGKVIATLRNDKAVDNLNELLDTAYGTEFAKKYNNDNSAWLPHTLADKNMAKKTENVDTIIKGNTSLLDSRTKLGSMRENNNLYNRFMNSDAASESAKEYFKKYPKLFEENFNKALSNKYYDGMNSLAKQHKLVNDTLLDATFADRNTITNLQSEIQAASKAGDSAKLKTLTEKYNSLTDNSAVKYLTEYDSKIPSGYTKITNEHAQKIKSKLEKLKQATMSGSEKDTGYDKLIDMFNTTNGSVAINDDVLRMLEWQTDTKSKNALLSAYDSWLNAFKSTKTLSVTNQLNNLVGNSSNLYLSGIGVVDQARLMPKAAEIVKNGQSLYTKQLAGEVLTEKESKIADIWKQFVDTGFGSEEIALDIQDLPDFMKDLALKGSTSKKITAKDAAAALPKLNMKINTFEDNVNRVAVMLKSMEDPSYLAKLGIDGASDTEKYRKAISKVMFDPTMMTDAEKTYLKRIIPFYTYAKNNLVYQIDNLGRNGSRYNRLMKTVTNLQKAATNGNEEDMASYVKDNLYIPIPGLSEDGSYTVLRATLPFGDLIDATDNPLNYIVNKAGPVIKTPFELATNTNAFTGQDLESFSGQKSTSIPFLTKKQEKALGDLTGLDVPIKNATRIYQGFTDSSENGGNLWQNIGNGLKNTVTMTNNIDTDKLNKQYEELDKLQELMKKYEQEGYTFSTMTELKKANQNSKVSELQAIFNKYGISSK